MSLNFLQASVLWLFSALEQTYLLFIFFFFCEANNGAKVDVLLIFGYISSARINKKEKSEMINDRNKGTRNKFTTFIKT